MNQDIVTFLKTDEAFGGLSNMAGGYAFRLNGTVVPTSEHLYQCMKYSYDPEIQTLILRQSSPMAAKMTAKKREFRSRIRQDWEGIKLEVMDYCLRVKLVWNWVRFGKLLERTGRRGIYEISSKKDRYWGVVQDGEKLVGENCLGRLLMKLRDEYLDEDNSHLHRVAPPATLDLRLQGEPLESIDRSGFY